MKIQQILQKCLTDWKNISQIDFCLLDSDNHIFLSTCDKKLPAESKLEEFRQSSALCVSNTSCCLYKIMENHSISYILIVWGKAESTATIGELAVCQVQSLLAAYAEKSDKNTFMQNLLLGSYSDVDAFNRAKKLHIATSVQRAVFLVETKQTKDENALATIRNIFSARTRDFITAIDDTGIIIIRELPSTETYEDLESIAYMLVDMLNTEAMTSAWVAYSNLAEDISRLPDAYKEAHTALEVGKIFYADKNVFGYNQLGIGRLIYQLPVSICEMFIDEIFKEETLDSIDEETLITIRTFFENNLNLSETSRQLYVHRNTLVYRFEKLQRMYSLTSTEFLICDFSDLRIQMYRINNLHICKFLHDPAYSPEHITHGFSQILPSVCCHSNQSAAFCPFYLRMIKIISHRIVQSINSCISCDKNLRNSLGRPLRSDLVQSNL